MVVSVFGSEINLVKKKPRGRGEVLTILEEETPSQEMTKFLSTPLDISDNRAEGTTNIL